MRNPLSGLVLSVLAAVGSILGADPIITTVSIVAALARFLYAWRVSRRYVLPVHQASAQNLALTTR